MAGIGFLKDALDVAQGAYVQSDDPGVGPAKRLWIDTTDGYVLKKRNEADDGWDVIGGLGTRARRTIAAADDEDASDDIVFLNTDGGAFDFTLLTDGARTRPLTIKNIGSAGNDGTVDPDGGTIDGDPTYVLADGDCITIVLQPGTDTTWETIR